jgi:hypothetical protein
MPHEDFCLGSTGADEAVDGEKLRLWASRSASRYFWRQNVTQWMDRGVLAEA